MKKWNSIRIDDTTFMELTLCENGKTEISINKPDSTNIALMSVDQALELAECLLNLAEMRNNQLKEQNNETN